QYRVSNSMVAYRLYQQGILNQEKWKEVVCFFQEQWRKSQKEKYQKTKGAPNPHLVKRRDLGGGLISLTNRMLNAGILSPTKAAKILGVRPTNVYKLLAV